MPLAKELELEHADLQVGFFLERCENCQVFDVQPELALQDSVSVVLVLVAGRLRSVEHRVLATVWPSELASEQESHWLAMVSVGLLLTGQYQDGVDDVTCQGTWRPNRLVDYGPIEIGQEPTPH